MTAPDLPRPGPKAGRADGRPRRRGPRAPEARRGNALHAGAWWIWALGLATAASRTTNPLLLALVAAVAGYVVAARRTDAPWARSYGAFLRLGVFVLLIRLVFAVLLGSPVPGTHVLVTLPEVPLPHWAQGVRLGGRVTAEGVVFALRDGMKLAALLVCVGAANALANPARLLKSLPGALYEAGVAVVVAMTFAPHLVADVARLRAARRLRGRGDRGVRALLQVGLPVLEGALERSIALAAAMDARGYGRTAHVPPSVRRATAALTLGGLLGMCAGTYALLSASGAGYGLPVLLIGLAAAMAGLRLGGRRSVRTRYRPDRWGPRAWLVAASGVAAAALMIAAASYAPDAMDPPAYPLTSPGFPLWPALSLLTALLPAFVAPVPPALTAAGRPGRVPYGAEGRGTGEAALPGPRRDSGGPAGSQREGDGPAPPAGQPAGTRQLAEAAPSVEPSAVAPPTTEPSTVEPLAAEPPTATPTAAPPTVESAAAEGSGPEAGSGRRAYGAGRGRRAEPRPDPNRPAKGDPR